MIGDDLSLTNANLAITTLPGLDLTLNPGSSEARGWSEGVPAILVEDEDRSRTE